MKFTTKKGTEVYQIHKGITINFLIIKNDLKIVVDTGVHLFWSSIKNSLIKHIGENEAIDYLFLTHTHFDHALNAKRIKEAFSAKIIVNKNEAECLQKGYTVIPHGTIPFTKVTSYIGRNYAKWIGKYPAVEADIIADDKSLINNEPDLQIIHNPGHTLGSQSLIVDNEFAFIGDCIYPKQNDVFPPFANDASLLMQSWKKLLDTDCELFFPGHKKPVNREIMEKSYAKHYDIQSMP